MPHLLAITGKGGVGKTTLAALLVSRLIARGCAPVLAVDADPNTNLDRMLGVRADKTVGSVREEARQIAGKGLAAGVSKQELLELKISESLAEADGFDLIAMGRPEGPGCYCYANNVLSQVIRRIASNYPFVVMDNEAGLENLSRRIVTRVNLLVMVSDPSARGLATVARLHELTKEMGIEYDKLAIVVNRLRRDELPTGALELKAATGADFLVPLPDDLALADLDERGGSAMQLPPDNPVVKRVGDFLTDCGLPLPPNIQHPASIIPRR